MRVELRRCSLGPLTRASIWASINCWTIGIAISESRCRISFMIITAFFGSTRYVWMFGMRVDQNAVETSPHGIVVARRARSRNGIVCCFQPAGTRVMRPSFLIAPPCGAPSTIVLSVPRLTPPPPVNASSSSCPPVSASCNRAARQSVGTTSKPTPGITMTPAAFAAACLARHASNTTISPVMSR